MEEFARIYEMLDKQCRYHCRHLGHLKGLIDNDDWMRVVNGSLSGRALLLGNSEITNALVLFNTRMFDTHGDTVTIHKLARALPSEEAIQEHHSNRMAEVGIAYELERYYSVRSEFVEARRELTKNGTHNRLRSLRDFHLAHNLAPDTEPERATLNELVQLTELVNELVDMAGYLVNSSRSVYREFSDRAEKETRMLFAALPVLATVEEN